MRGYIPSHSPKPAVANFNLQRFLNQSRAYQFWKWTAGRNEPDPGPVFLSQRRVYILPTRNGLVFAVALMLMLIGSINYNLSLGYVLTFLLAGMGIVSILHTFRNLAHMTVSAGRVQPVFAGETAYFGLNLTNARDEARRAIQFACGGSLVISGIPAEQTHTVTVPVKAPRRGWLPLPRVTLRTTYPLGFFRAWSYVQPAMKALVYPRPDQSALPPTTPSEESGDAINVGSGSDDFAGLRNTQQGDSPRHIAWKAVAGLDRMLTKLFVGRASRKLTFDWNDLPDALGPEARLSRLARYVLLAHECGATYALRIPGRFIAADTGEKHLERCMEALALYERT